MKKLLIALLVIGALATGYWLISPLWRNTEVDEPSPLEVIEPAMEVPDSVPEDQEEEYMEAMEEMKDVVMEVEEAMPVAPSVLAEGAFVAEAHEVEGSVILIESDSETVVRFENFKTINGPDLRIYLAADLDANDFVDLGAIRATEGNVNYSVPSVVDTYKYKYVLVWCRAFSVLFSYAELR